MWPPCTTPAEPGVDSRSPRPEGAEKHSYCVVVFSGSKEAILAQQVLTRAGMTVPVMPTPRELTAHCGLSLRFPLEAVPQVRDILNACKDLSEENSFAFYRMEYDSHSRAVTPME